MTKIRICVVFGGASSEHEVSCVSAASVLSHLSPAKYDITKIGITKDGRWLLYPGSTDAMKTGDWEKDPGNLPCSILPDRAAHGMVILGKTPEFRRLDCIFPVLHGKNGEDGTIQGLFDLSGIPYVGCGVLASAVGMDKSFTKLVAASIGVTQAKYLVFRRHDYDKAPDSFLNRAEEELGYPLFVKPANAGSSVGISKVKNRASLRDAVMLAFAHDRKIVLEEAVVGRELETAVLGNEEPTAAVVGEVLPAEEFYSYDAKYNNAASVLVIPAELPDGVSDKIRETAIRIFSALDGRGLSRVDFFLRERDGEIVFNEINTLPGFTDISMYSKLFDAAGVPYGDLVDRLVVCALEEHGEAKA
ncbi:MAG: D-alanine--D-alanine ligase [Clostridia bacterium]|nr:D-alanine--D-alanine ligase [Clostridia bacterium]